MNRRIGLIALALVLAIIGTFAVYAYANNADKRALSKTRSATVLYAKKPIPVGTTWGDAVKNGFLAKEKLPVSAAPSTAIQSTDASIPLSLVATADIASGQVVIREMFGEKQASTGILAIPAGLMAVTVSMPANADVAGFVQSGSEVAVYATYKLGKNGGAGKAIQKSLGTGGGDDLYVTKLLLPRATVIAVSQGAPSDLNGAKNATGGTGSDTVKVTLAVAQKDAERLILSQQIGQLYFGLLSKTSSSSESGGTLNLIITRPNPIFVR
jgi:pilus assembly protein CpaB